MPTLVSPIPEGFENPPAVCCRCDKPYVVCPECDEPCGLCAWCGYDTVFQVWVFHPVAHAVSRSGSDGVFLSQEASLLHLQQTLCEACQIPWLTQAIEVLCAISRAQTRVSDILH